MYILRIWFLISLDQTLNVIFNRSYFLIFKFPNFHLQNYSPRFSHQYGSQPDPLKIKELFINCLCSVLWDSLPEVVRMSPSMGSFKLSVKRILFLIHTD